ncbi:MAG TPA: hypothetical protein VGK22_00295 [Candidatus Angelobacter sp.]
MNVENSADIIPRPTEPLSDQSQSTTFQAPTAYEERFVAFLDILGWRRLIEESEKDSTAIARMGGALGFLKMLFEIPAWLETQARKMLEAKGETYSPHPDALEFSQFSDSIVISSPVTTGGAISILFELDRILTSLFYQSHFLIRGAVTRGPMYHKNPVAFGPALTKAYDLQFKAVYPRVIIDHSIMQFPAQSHQSFERLQGSQTELGVHQTAGTSLIS